MYVCVCGGTAFVCVCLLVGSASGSMHLCCTVHEATISIEINLFLPVNANISWLILLLAQFSETDRRYAFITVICRPFQSLHWAHNFLWGAMPPLLTWVGLTLDSCKYQPAYRRPNTSVFTVCKPYANLILTLTHKAPLWTSKALAASNSSFIVVKIYSACN